MRFIEITESDIISGIRNDPQACAVARAMEREFPEMHVEVLTRQINVCRDRKLMFVVARYHPTSRLGRFILDFDNGMKVQPGFYMIDDGTTSWES